MRLSQTRRVTPNTGRLRQGSFLAPSFEAPDPAALSQPRGWLCLRSPNSQKNLPAWPQGHHQRHCSKARDKIWATFSKATKVRLPYETGLWRPTGHPPASETSLTQQISNTRRGCRLSQADWAVFLTAWIAVKFLTNKLGFTLQNEGFCWRFCVNYKSPNNIPAR